MNRDFSSFVSSLYATYSAMLPQQQAPELNGMLLLRKGPSSLAFADEKHIIKIITANHHIVTPVREEYLMLEKLGNLGGNLFISPQALDYGNNPDYVVMSNIGRCLASHPDRASYFETASAAMGEFAGKIWASHQLVHTDIHMTNFTVPNRNDGKIGIIDIAAVKEGLTPEEMFWCPLLRREISCPVIAENFTEASGLQIDFDRVKHIAGKRLPKYMEASDPTHAQDAKKNVEANLAEWQATIQNQRPAALTSQKSGKDLSL